MKKILSCILSLIMIFALCLPAFAGSSDPAELKFRNGEFRILHITDPQDDAHTAYDLPNFLKLAIETTNPDLIVFTGDIVEDSRSADKGIDDEDTREGVCVYNSDDELNYEETLKNTTIATDAVFSIIEEAGIPFVTAQGNNDYICGITNEDWLKLYSKYDHCLTKDESEGNDRIDCHVEIKGSNGETAFNIWMMDTERKGVNDDSINWYKETSDKLKEANGGEPVPSFVFQHIFTKDIGNLFEVKNAWDDGVVVKDGVFCRLDRSKATGHFTEVSALPGTTTKEFKAWKSQGDVLGAYFGHEHYEGYTGTVKGIELGFTYGCEFAKSGPYGVRLFTLYEDDIKNYDNEIYVYTGSVKTNDAKMVLQQDESYPTYTSTKEKLTAYWNNFKANIVVWFEEVFD